MTGLSPSLCGPFDVVRTCFAPLREIFRVLVAALPRYASEGSRGEPHASRKPLLVKLASNCQLKVRDSRNLNIHSALE